jgi:hypothetical protein
MLAPMADQTILSLIDAEIARLKQVRALLANTGKVTAKLTARGLKKIAAEPKVKGKAKAKKTRVLSPEARNRIADAQRKRWAAQKGKKEA